MEGTLKSTEQHSSFILSGLWGPEKNPLKSIEHHSSIIMMGLRGAFNCSPNMPRDTSLSDNQYNFSSLALIRIPIKRNPVWLNAIFE